MPLKVHCAYTAHAVCYWARPTTATAIRKKKSRPEMSQNVFIDFAMNKSYEGQAKTS